MGTKLIDGKAYAQAVRDRVWRRVLELVDQTGQAPGLANVLEDNDPASEVYVCSKGKQAVEASVSGLVRADWIKPCATDINVGINSNSAPAMSAGDVDFANARDVAGAITPVPGDVGWMTIACLLANSLSAYCHLHGLLDRQLFLAQQDLT